MAESQMFCSIKPFIHCTVTQKQPELVPPRRTPTKEPLGFYSLKSLLLGLFLSVSIHPTAVFSFLIQKISNSQFRLSLSLFIVCLAQVSPWRSLLPQRLAVLVSGSHPELNLHLTLQLASRATQTKCVPL